MTRHCTKVFLNLSRRKPIVLFTSFMFHHPQLDQTMTRESKALVWHSQIRSTVKWSYITLVVNATIWLRRGGIRIYLTTIKTTTMTTIHIYTLTCVHTYQHTHIIKVSVLYYTVLCLMYFDVCLWQFRKYLHVFHIYIGLCEWLYYPHKTTSIAIPHTHTRTHTRFGSHTLSNSLVNTFSHNASMATAFHPSHYQSTIPRISLHPSIDPFINPSIQLSIYSPIHQSNHPSIPPFNNHQFIHFYCLVTSH